MAQAEIINNMLKDDKRVPVYPSAQIEKVLNLYKQVSLNPSLTGAKISCLLKNGLNIRSKWSQKNLERNSKQKFVRDFVLDSNLEVITHCLPIDVSEQLSTITQDEKLQAVLRQVSGEKANKQFIEIWDSQHLLKSYDLSALDEHGDVYTDQTFSSFHWSPDNTRLLYIAEKKLSKLEPFYKQKSKPKKPADEEPIRGEEYYYKAEWGEQLVGKHKSVIVVLNIVDDTIVPQKFVPDEYFPSQVIWGPNGKDIVGVVHKLENFYLGVYACSNRESYIFSAREDADFKLLSKPKTGSSSPQFSPDGKYLLWMERDLSPPHRHCNRLMKMSWDVNENYETLIDVVKTEVEITNNKKFYGLYNGSILKRSFTDDSKYIIVSTTQRYSVKSYFINLETKEMSEIESDDNSSLIVLDVYKNYILFSKESLMTPPQLVIGKINENSIKTGKINFYNVTTPLNNLNTEQLMYQFNEFTYSNTDESVKDFNYIYFGPKDGQEKSVPLLLTGHGGPNAAFNNLFSPLNSIFTSLGFAIIQVNYRGSLGMGAENVDFLLGKSGSADVLDCVTAVKDALKKYSWLNPENVSTFGGSHGGFLGAHLTGQYNNMFRTAVLMNPVVDITSMFAATDIPDWCLAQIGFNDYLGPLSIKEYNPEILSKMFYKSPIAYVDKVKAPTLICLGSKDLRVPFFQGKLWYDRLIKKGVHSQLIIYEDNHSILNDAFEIDEKINIVLWILKHTKDFEKKEANK